jgi:DNA sulfur modification protein DndB
MDYYLPDDKKGWTKFKRFRPPDKILEGYYSRAKKLWDGFLDHFPPLAELVASKPPEEVAARYRNRDGGSLLFRPVGISMLVTVTKLFEESGFNLDSILKKLASLPLNLNEEPWTGLLWDAANRRMIVPAENQRAALWLLFHGLGGDLAKLNSSRENLKEELSGILGKDVDAIVLPSWGRIR